MVKSTVKKLYRYFVLLYLVHLNKRVKRCRKRLMRLSGKFLATGRMYTSTFIDSSKDGYSAKTTFVDEVEQ